MEKGEIKKVEIGDATLYRGDCLEILPTLGKVGCTIYSPPYNTLRPTTPTGMHAKGAWVQRSHSAYFDQRPEQDYQTWQQQVLELCMSLTTEGLVWVNHKIRYRNKEGIHPLSFLKHPPYCEIIWARPGSPALNNRRFALSHEYIYGFGVPKFWNNALNTFFTVWHISPAILSEHPVAFPLEIPRRLIAASCDPQSLVIDPFMGSGTTGVAALRMGRRFIGIEVDPRYFEIACRRIEEASRQPDMFNGAPPAKAEQEGLL